MIICCIAVHNYHELLETTVYVIASSAATVKISRPPLGTVTYSNIRNYFHAILTKMTTTKVICPMLDTSEQ